MWYSRSRDGRELVDDDERGGRPKSPRTEVNIAVVLAWSKMTAKSHKE
jgi:hypothetical protein